MSCPARTEDITSSLLTISDIYTPLLHGAGKNQHTPTTSKEHTVKVPRDKTPICAGRITKLTPTPSAGYTAKQGKFPQPFCSPAASIITHALKVGKSTIHPQISPTICNNSSHSVLRPSYTAAQLMQHCARISTMYMGCFWRP